MECILISQPKLVLPKLSNADDKTLSVVLLSLLLLLPFSKFFIVYIFTKHYFEHLPVIKRDDLCNLNEYLVLEMGIGGEKCFFSC